MVLASRDDRKKQGLLLDQFLTPVFADKLKAGTPIEPVTKDIVTMYVPSNFEHEFSSLCPARCSAGTGFGILSSFDVPLAATLLF